MLEEGVAVWFSLNIPAYPFPSYKQMAVHHIQTNPSSANYKHALEIYERILAVEPNAVRILREIDPILDNLTPDLIIDRLPLIETDLATELCERRIMR